ncbi:crossover junction endodeoxyribonuclease RuvC [uncultured Porphyromonas sp.]|uniref:crossover junction endodeoxyribonuclease RuvC n=1 Tax=uncultured Porphyromonas sp. TaxID=159274 RepID=UPI0026376D05|nr:crossover junction endodeoxyribonuclease RuvC [uncultured Porphyromonas sp.]
MEQQVIIGIDPGTIVMGYGVLRIAGNKPTLEAMGILRLDRYKSHYDRLLKIQEAVEALISRYAPTAMALEAPFYGVNVQTTLKLGRAQGAAMVAALKAGVAVTEYAPSTIKRMVTGKGNASKEQVAALLQYMLKIPEEAMMEKNDATDAVAVALTHHLQQLRPHKSSSSSSWSEYIKRNPDKVKK